MYKDWKVSLSVLNYEGDDEKKLAKKEQAEEERVLVARWCNDNQEYMITRDDTYCKVAPIPEPTKEEKASFIREIRDSYLKQYVDPILCNPLRWTRLSEEEKEDIRNYRQYLLDIPQDKKFPDVNVMSFAEWLNV